MILMCLPQTISAIKELVLVGTEPALFRLFLAYFEKALMSSAFIYLTMMILDFWHGTALPTYVSETPTSPWR